MPGYRALSGAMHPSSNSQAGLFGIAFLQAVRRALPQMLLATIAAGLAIYLAQSWIEPRYVAEVRLTVEGNTPSSAVQAHTRALRDPIRLYSVATELGLKSRVDFEAEKNGFSLWDLLSFNRFPPYAALQDEDERLLAAVYERLNIAAGEERGDIVVRFASSDAELAAQFVNRLAEVFLESQSQEGDGRVKLVSWAEPPEQTAPLRKSPLAIVGMATTLLVCLGLVALHVAFRMAARRRKRFSGTTGGANCQPQAAKGGFGKLKSAAEAADRLLALSGSEQRGCRTMVAGEALGIDATDEAIALAERLGAAGRKVVLIRWKSAGGDVRGAPPPAGKVGLNDLLEGRATFEEIIARLPGTQAHAIAAGSALSDEQAALDLDLLSLVLDTLDEVYEHIVIVADHEEARTLFAVLEGRFDACISVGEAGRETDALKASFDRFLGFEVTDIQIVRLERKSRTASDKLPYPALQPRIA